MDAHALLDTLAGAGLSVMADGDRLVIRPAYKLTDDMRAVLREHKRVVLAALSQRFDWSPLDPESAKEALQERIGILMDSGMPQSQAEQEAAWQMERARCWERFQGHARIIVSAAERSWSERQVGPLVVRYVGDNPAELAWYADAAAQAYADVQDVFSVALQESSVGMPARWNMSRSMRKRPSRASAI